MTDSTQPPMKSEEQDDSKPPAPAPPRLCDYCNQTTAVLYCRADSARLCLSCDREVHSTNQLFTKHTRWLLCDVCDSSPASIFCESDRSVLCQNCDWETHNLSLSSLHNRRPIEGFCDCPSANELVGILGFEDLGVIKKGSRNDDVFVGAVPDGSDLGDGFSDFIVWDGFDDLIASGDSGRNLKAMGVPPLPKNRNAACGRHKEEIIRQLRLMARLEPENGEIDPFSLFESVPSEQNLLPNSNCTGSDHSLFPAYEEHLFQWQNDDEDAANQAFISSILRTNLDEAPDKQTNSAVIGTHADDEKDEAQQPQHQAMTVPNLPKVAAHEINSQERDSAISRYKEKKKTRRYDKHIRYESRKARAESRTRVRGRFAKIQE
ncbi:Zinc finger protein CONSTANS-LIKE 13 [Linum perenne]